MSANNFCCPSCKKESFVSSYNYNGEVYKDKKTKSIIKCDICKDIQLKYIDKPFNGVPSFGKFESMSPMEKRKVIKKRAHLDSKKNFNHQDVKGFKI